MGMRTLCPKHSVADSLNAGRTGSRAKRPHVLLPEGRQRPRPPAKGCHGKHLNAGMLPLDKQQLRGRDSMW